MYSSGPRSRKNKKLVADRLHQRKREMTGKPVKKGLGERTVFYKARRGRWNDGLEGLKKDHEGRPF